MSTSCDLDNLLRVVIAVKNNQPIEIRKKGLEHWTSPLKPTMLNFDEFEYRVVGEPTKEVFLWRYQTPYGPVFGNSFTTASEAHDIQSRLSSERQCELVRFVEVGVVESKEPVPSCSN